MLTCPNCRATPAAGTRFCPECGTRLPDAATVGDVQNETAARLGRALGPGYEVGRLLGRGGFGEVFAAFDRSLKRRVAVKVLRADVAESQLAVDRFRREAEALARLRHPHIMPVFGIGEGEGLTFFVMPEIEGESLAGLLARGERLPMFDACRILAETADALAAAHRAGVVHRDIKPDNILLEGPERHALLMDFGIAKSGGSDSRLTGTGMIIGTPAYMSPEQASGDSIGPAADIYSLGLVAYELLAERAVFADATSPQQLVAAHLTQVPEDPRRVNPRIPATIAKAVMRCLRKDPQERWPTSEALARAMNDALRDVPRGPEIEVPDSAPTLPTRRRAILLLLGAAGLAITLATYRRADLDFLTPQHPRAEALAQAESLLRALGVPEYQETAQDFSGGSTRASSALNASSTSPRPLAPALTRLPLTGWRFAFFNSGRPGYVQLTMGGPGWVSDFNRVLDTVSVPRGRPPALETDVNAILRSLGWNPDSLTIEELGPPQMVERGRVQRSFRWTAAPILGAAPRADSITRRLTMMVTDGHLTRFTVTRSVSDQLHRAARADAREAMSSAALVLGVSALLLIGIARAWRRRALRLERVLPLAIATSVVFAATFVLSTENFGDPFSVGFSPGVSRWPDRLIESALGLVFLSVCTVVLALLYALLESHALRTAPRLLAGYQNLSFVPDVRRLLRLLPTAAPSGFIISAVTVAIASGVAVLSGVPLRASAYWMEGHRQALSDLAARLTFSLIGVALGTIILLMIGATRSAIRSGLAITGLAGAVAGIALVNNQVPATVAMIGVATAGLAGVALRRGVLEALVAAVAMWLAVETAQAWRSPFADPRLPTGTLVLLLLATVVASVLSTSRRRSDGSTSRTTPTS